METKICKKCEIEKSLNDFYKHPKTKDGYSPECKECKKEIERNNYSIKANDPEFVKKERQRGREKYKRLGYNQRQNAHNENKNTCRFLKTKGINLTGLEIHHWDYNQQNDVFILNKKAHRLLHKYLSFDKLTSKFHFQNQLLDTKQKHYEAIEEIFKITNSTYEVGFYPLIK